MKVWLDDLRHAPDGWVRTYNARQTINVIRGGAVTHLSLDHDLGNEEIVGTGYDVMHWLEREFFKGNFHNINPDNIKFHTANIVGRMNMERCLRQLKKVYNS